MKKGFKKGIVAASALSQESFLLREAFPESPNLC